MNYFRILKTVSFGQGVIRRLFLCALLLFPGTVSAQEAACNAEIWDAMRAKAWLEAQVENVTNQNLVAKPDSVFEYSCFLDYVFRTAEYIGPVFSETQEFGAVPGHDLASLDNALEAAVIIPLNTWLENFGGDNDYFGRRAPGLSPECGLMANVWYQVMCNNGNFLDKEHDGFFSYQQHNGYEVRQLEIPCDNPPPWGDYIDLAIVDPPWLAEYVARTSYLYEMVNLRLRIGICGAPTSRSHVMVRSYPDGEFPDAVCTNPGCAYNGSTCAGL